MLRRSGGDWFRFNLWVPLKYSARRLLQYATDHLDEITVEQLQDALDNVDGSKPTQWLLDAIA